MKLSLTNYQMLRSTFRNSCSGNSDNPRLLKFNTVLVGLIMLLGLFTMDMSAALQLAKIINSGMVLQRDVDVPLWGTAEPGDSVSVTFNLQTYGAKADTAGKWSITLPAMTAGGPHEMLFKSGTDQKTLTDVYVGDVWLATGQSNIEFTLNNADGGAAAIAAANDQKIRQFKVPKGLANEPSDVLPDNSVWRPATSSYAGGFSAIGYFFARDLRQVIDIPIGILNISYGGSRIETWMSDEMLGYDENDIVLANGEPERQPTVAFNKMINPVLRFPIKGFIFYQGESNADNMEDALAYGDLFKTFITGWRALWGLGDIPFLWVQLPNYGTVYAEPQNWDAWPCLRENQTAALSLPNTGEAITIDVGGTDIHPTNKEPVGHRLSLVARKVAYGEDIVYSGPRYRANLLRDDGTIAVSYNHIGGGLVAKGVTDGSVNGFAIAGENGQLVWADAVIEGDQVIVSNTAVPEPILLRYAWEYNPANVNLYNAEDLPAAPFLVDVNPGFKITSFKAGRSTIEQGQSTTLSWMVYGASSITLDGTPVDSAATITVSPLETTKYKLLAINRSDANELDSAEVTITVLDPDLINRTLNRPTVASTFEACCGQDRIPGYAVDGDFDTRWSSAWQIGDSTTLPDPNIDDDPDDEWIYVDMGDYVDLDRVILYWEAGYASAYDLEMSYDSYVWRTVYEERLGDGGEDNIVFTTPPSGRYLRVHGFQRATQYGYSLWEIATYGGLSTKQPPTVRVSSTVGNVFPVAADVTFVAAITDADGEVQEVKFYVGDVLLGVDSETPFEANWTSSGAGEYGVTAVAMDNDSLLMQSDPYLVFVDDGMLTRFEAERASTTGQVYIRNSSAASGGSFVELQDAWTISFDNVEMPNAGECLLSIGYQLNFESPKTQYLVINGDSLKEIEFTAPNTSSWLQLGLKVELQAGMNEIAIHGFWNWMSIDFIAVDGAVSPQSVENIAGLPREYRLAQNYPNPFNPTTKIQYDIPETSFVIISIYNMNGQIVERLVNQKQNPGFYTINWDARNIPSGVYFYQIKVNDPATGGAKGFQQVRKCLLIK